MMKTKDEITAIARAAREASYALAGVSSDTKNDVLLDMAEALRDNSAQILSANRKDVKKAKSARVSAALVDRLALNEKRIEGMSAALQDIARLEDPVGEVLRAWRVPSGLWIHKVRVPIGVIAIIYEARPNVTADCAGLCFKSGNSVILRGGSDALNSNMAIYDCLRKVAAGYHLPDGVISLVTTTDRQAVDFLLTLKDEIALVMPRGGEGLINHVVEKSRIPVIKHYQGICHVYVDEWADLNMAEEVCFNAKVQRPGVCNAMECMLVHKDTAARFLPSMLKRFKHAGVQIRGCETTRRIFRDARPASEKDYHTEYLDLILSVKVVDDLPAAVNHINRYGSHHSDSIVTENYDNALHFLRQVDSACVYVNASTRFTDGGQFGMGAEIGISTDKIHARGPMALEELTTYKYMVFGNGQIRA